jgi:YVTN family beta-propeller protein
MSDYGNFDRMARAWLELGPNEAPDRAVSAVLQAVETTPQVRPLSHRLPWLSQRLLWVSQRLPWRYPTMTRFPIAASVAVAVVIVVGGFLFMRSNDTTGVGGPSPSASANPSAETSPTISASPEMPDPISVTPEAAVSVTKPFTMAFDGQSIWVLSESGSLVRIDPGTNATDPALELGGQPQGVSADATGVWVTQWSPGLVYRVDPTTQEIVATVETGMAKGVLAADGAVWVANTRDGTVTRIDPATNEVVTTITVGSIGSGGPNWLTSGFGSIWVGVPRDSTIVRIDPATNDIQATFASPAGTSPCGGLVAGVDAVWITSCHDGKSAARIDPSTNTAAGPIYLGGLALTPTLINNAPWASIDRDGGAGDAIVRIDPTTNQIDRVLSPGVDFNGGVDMVVAAGSVWVVDAANNQVLRLPLSAFGS